MVMNPRRAIDPNDQSIDQPSPGAGDVIAEIYDHVMAGADASELRRIFSGNELYIASKPRLTRAQRSEIQAELRTSSAPAVARRHNISLRHCYRLRKQVRKNRDSPP